ncbi:hypothetical protein [Bifidobacterium leontopitheci]|uniref:Uncharacterized protein n=1 Tax=Bifidobacterium leontopitheci TaxID=2650774 RepID=A0A6I1GR16_9BIFI|nr:hypothetical protein [Bifidobacterium leontopitheci]KAB7788991.1 hypothetical protein F7D09_2048 [Bifidobacterium leontopitheci]
MDSMKRGMPTNDAVLRMHAMMAENTNEWYLTGDHDGPRIITHDTDDIKDSSVLKTAVTGNPYSIIQDVTPEYQASDRSAKVGLGSVDRASGKKISKKLGDMAVDYADQHGFTVWKAVKADADEAKSLIENAHPSVKKWSGIGDKAQSRIAQLDIVISTIDTACELLGWKNPIDEWIRKPFSGDWTQIDQSIAQWEALSQGLDKLSKTLDECAQEAKNGAWEGKAGEAFATCCGTVSKLFGDGVSPSKELAQALEGLSELAKNTLQLVLETLDTVISMAKGIMNLIQDGSLWWDGFHTVKLFLDGFDMAATVRKAWKLKDKLIDAFQKLQKAMSEFAECTSAMTSLADQTQGIRAVAAS